MENLKRYNTNAVGMSGYVTMFEFEHGEWVKFSDVKEISKTPTNTKSMSLQLAEQSYKCAVCGCSEFDMK